MTLDGVIELEGDWFHPGAAADDMRAVEREFAAACDAVLLGRQTYEDFRGYWPKQTDDTTGITEALNRTMKYVVTSTMRETDWQNTTFLRGPVAEEVARLKAQPGKDIDATGSITLVHALIEAGLVDEYRLFVYPVIVGRGRRLFPGGFDGKLRLVETRSFASGVVLLTYRTAQE
jgi:dihydrofolate reductase